MVAMIGGSVSAKMQSSDKFGPRLQSLRAAAGLTQSQLAERANLHLITISKLERGRIDPSWTTVNALASALGVTPDAFLGDDDQGEPDDDPDRPDGKAK